jgi:hypothetical protein
MGIPAPPGGHLSELKTVAQMKMLFPVLLFLDRQQNHGSKQSFNSPIKRGNSVSHKSTQ